MLPLGYPPLGPPCNSMQPGAERKPRGTRCDLHSDLQSNNINVRKALFFQAGCISSRRYLKISAGRSSEGFLTKSEAAVIQRVEADIGAPSLQLPLPLLFREALTSAPLSNGLPAWQDSFSHIAHKLWHTQI